MKPPAPDPMPVDIAAVRARLEENPSRQYWRSMAEVIQAGEQDEFAPGASTPPDEVNRRHFLKLMGASLALAGVEGCTREPVEKIVPYVRQPEKMVPGIPLHFATAMPLNGFVTPLIVESHEGHPTKIEGNPGHPASLGATGIFQQAALLDLYDPDRAQTVTNGGKVRAWADFLAALNDVLQEQATRHGAGLRILTGSVTSPTLLAQMDEVLKKFPEARRHQHQPISRDNALAGAQMVFGQPVETRYRFDRAKTILSLDADFLFDHPDHLRHAREFASGRRVTESTSMNRLYAVESSPTLTGSMADHRLPLERGRIADGAAMLAQQLGLNIGAAAEASGPLANWITEVVHDLEQSRGRSLIIAGEAQPPFVHALAHLANANLGNIGQTVEYFESAETRWTNQSESLRQLTRDMAAGSVECLVIIGGNPVFDAPADFHFAELLPKIKFAVHLSSSSNETSVLCGWHIPETHFLESWSDGRAFEGQTSLIQPLVAPFYDSHSAHELLDALTGILPRNGYDIIHDHWRGKYSGTDFDKWWYQALHNGFIADTTLPPVTLMPNTTGLGAAIENSKPAASASALEICFAPDPTIWDGTFANNGWLQELPKPFSKVTWDNPALISPALAEREHLANGDVVELRLAGRTARAPVWIMPGQAENSITLHLGLGRSHVGQVGRGAGFNFYPLRASSTLWQGASAMIVKTGVKHPLASTQQNHSVNGRDILRTATLREFENHSFPDPQKNPPRPDSGDTLYNPDEFKNADYAWGMSIDLNACIGCNACVLACQSENNIPVVGKEEVSRGRDMAWIRIDQYFSGGLDAPRFNHQPVPCMQCENAPCELVCPVGATLHDHEGLNLQVYNRCVGTRYCSNNCPYKVRRFNFFRYADYETPSLKPMRNPNVTVRWRGVMEKCTYCIQRISAARISSQKDNRRIREGEIKTACQQVCPAQAIVFGDIHNPASAVAKLKKHPLDYSMLGDLNTRPRTTYLARITNPNPAMENGSVKNPA